MGESKQIEQKDDEMTKYREKAFHDMLDKKSSRA